MNKTKKRILLAFFALALIIAIANPGCTTIHRSGWVRERGQLHFYDENGQMVTGWLQRDDGTYYLLDSGVKATGWQQIDGKNYYFTKEGPMYIGWLDSDDGRRLLGTDGVQVFGLTQYGGHTYYLNEDGLMVTGWAEIQDNTYYFDDQGCAAMGLTAIDDNHYVFHTDGILANGWAEVNGKTYLTSPDGIPLTGWQEVDGITYYLDTDGSLLEGWLEYGGHTYYMQDGISTTGILALEGKNYYFDSRGWNVLMVNPWNAVPEGYETALSDVGGGHSIATEAAADFSAMVYAMQLEELGPIITSSYRSITRQQEIFDDRMAGYISQGMSEEEAYATTATAVAIPGTSEHQLGLAIDMTDANYNKLDEGQMETPTQLWLIENSWKYGFILRYPNGKSDITGIIYEPWHYRYVGKTLAEELHELDVTMEEYFDILSTDKSLTASNPANGNTAQ